MQVLAFDLGLTRAAPTACALVCFTGLVPTVRWALALRPQVAGATWGELPTVGSSGKARQRPLLADSAPWGARVAAIGLLALATAQGQPCELLAYEASYFARNLQTLRKLAALEGVILLIAAQLDLPVVAVQPAEAKIALAGDAQADKLMMIAAARRLGWPGSSSHEADAIGVALAAEAQHRRAQLLTRRAA